MLQLAYILSSFDFSNQFHSLKLQKVMMSSEVSGVRAMFLLALLDEIKRTRRQVDLFGGRNLPTDPPSSKQQVCHVL